jgi:hypothetical protein
MIDFMAFGCDSKGNQRLTLHDTLFSLGKDLLQNKGRVGVFDCCFFV